MARHSTARHGAASLDRIIYESIPERYRAAGSAVAAKGVMLSGSYENVKKLNEAREEGVEASTSGRSGGRGRGCTCVASSSADTMRCS